MADKRKQMFIELLTSFVLFTLVKGQCSDPPQIADANSTVVIEHKLVVYICNSGLWSTSDTVLSSQCNGNTWTEITATCDSTQQHESCQTEATVPENAKIIKQVDGKFTANKCLAPKRWLSGTPARIRQCRKAQWTEIWDVCDEGCPVPRDCGDVAALGIDKSAVYMVIPSGNPSGQIFKVRCWFNEGGNWTYIFKNFNSPADKLESEFVSGYDTGSENDHQYFAGAKYLGDLSLPLENIENTPNEQYYVLEILFKGSDTNVNYYAVYGNFTVDEGPTYSILSLGEYHGNAGDAMCPLLNSNFMFSDQSSPQWWGVNQDNEEQMKKMNANFLSKGSQEWYPMQMANLAADISFADIRIRRVTEDQKNSCPPMVGSEPWWDHTWVDIPQSRSIGTNISWQCIGENFMEGIEGGERSYMGTVTCLDGTPPSWDKTVHLPCTMKCPENFQVREDGRRCFMFSEEEVNGLYEAVNKCLAFNSTLAVMKSASDVNVNTTGLRYFVNHAQTGSSQIEISAPLPPDFNCSTSTCTITDTEKCTVVNSEASYEHVDCLGTFRYICEFPYWCPPGYDRVNGNCYMVIDSYISFKESLKRCEEDGSGLALPVPQSRESELIQYIREKNFTSPISFFTGLQSGDPARPFMILELEENDKLTPATIDDTGPSHAICHYPHPIGCTNVSFTGEYSNMTMTWNELTTVGTEVIYECDFGFFVNGNTSIVNQTITCLGMLGGWQPNVLPCHRMPVCENTPLDVRSSVIERVPDDDSVYLGGMMNFTCPEGMAFEDLNTTLRVTCEEIDSGVFSYIPSVIPSCTVCLGFNASNFTYTTNTWTDSNIYYINTTIELTCIDGYEHSYLQMEQNITCTENGWNYNEIRPCYPVCNTSALDPGNNVVPVNVTNNTVGSSFVYNCFPNYYFIPSPAYPTPIPSVTITCNDSALWESERGDEPLECIQLCIDPPPSTPDFAQSSWDGRILPGLQNDSVSYNCSSNYLFGNFSSTWEFICNGTHWVPEVSDQFICRKACMEELQEILAGAERQDRNFTYGWVNQNVAYQCPNGTANKDGMKSESIVCTENGWSNISAEFNCEKVCIEAPPSPLSPATYNATNDLREGITIQYVCEGGFRTEGTPSFLLSTCANNSWELQTIPECRIYLLPSTVTGI